MQRTKIAMARRGLSGQRSTSQHRRVAVRLRVRPRRVGREAGLAEARGWRSGIRLCVLLAGGCPGRAAAKNAQVNSLARQIARRRRGAGSTPRAHQWIPQPASSPLGNPIVALGIAIDLDAESSRHAIAAFDRIYPGGISFSVSPIAAIRNQLESLCLKEGFGRGEGREFHGNVHRLLSIVWRHAQARRPPRRCRPGPSSLCGLVRPSRAATCEGDEHSTHGKGDRFRVPLSNRLAATLNLVP